MLTIKASVLLACLGLGTWLSTPCAAHPMTRRNPLGKGAVAPPASHTSAHSIVNSLPRTYLSLDTLTPARQCSTTGPKAKGKRSSPALHRRTGITGKEPQTLYHGTWSKVNADSIAAKIDLAKSEPRGDFANKRAYRAASFCCPPPRAHIIPRLAGFYLTDRFMAAAQFGCYGGREKPAEAHVLGMCFMSSAALRASNANPAHRFSEYTWDPKGL